MGIPDFNYHSVDDHPIVLMLESLPNHLNSEEVHASRDVWNKDCARNSTTCSATRG